ncbi:MAG: hypothetical protein ACRC2V_13990 [Xenococcaceae cyanobacterium]
MTKSMEAPPLKGGVASTRLQQQEIVSKASAVYSIEQLMQYPLTKLKKIARQLNITNRSKLTKNLVVAQQELIPLIVGQNI